MGEKNSIRLVTADDLPLMRSGLRAFLTAYEEFSLVGEASNGEEAIQLCELLKPDIVLMDLKMPVMDGVAATRLIRQRWPKIKVLALISFRDTELVQAALQAGAAAHALKDVTADELAETIRRLHQKRRVSTPKPGLRAEQVDLLEQLVQAMDIASTDRTRLSGLLRSHLPGFFPGCQIELRIFPNQSLLCYPADHLDFLPDAAWRWLQSRAETLAFFPGEPVPWGGRLSTDGQLLLTPLISNNSGQPLGGLCILQHGLDNRSLGAPGIRKRFGRSRITGYRKKQYGGAPSTKAAPRSGAG